MQPGCPTGRRVVYLSIVRPSRETPRGRTKRARAAPRGKIGPANASLNRRSQNDARKRTDIPDARESPSGTCPRTQRLKPSELQGPPPLDKLWLQRIQSVGGGVNATPVKQFALTSRSPRALRSLVTSPISWLSRNIRRMTRKRNTQLAKASSGPEPVSAPIGRVGCALSARHCFETQLSLVNHCSTA